MPDILIPLYSLPPIPAPVAGIVIRRPLAHEKSVIRSWIKEHFHAGWADEFDTSFSHQPVTTFIALRERKLIGFASYEATCRAFFGPTGVIKEERGLGIGRMLLLHAMYGLRDMGYGYGIIGGAGPTDFYVKTLGGIIIADSWPGIYPSRPIDYGTQ